jgi:hypothetical protein
MDSEQVFEFWDEYDWNWKSTADVEKFVDDAIETGCYEYSLEAFGYFIDGTSGQNWYECWWSPVHSAIKSCVKNFSEEEMDKVVAILLKPFDDYSDNGDQAIYDALIVHYPQFLAKSDDYTETLNIYYKHWCEFSWFPFMEEFFNWTYFGVETIAKSPQIPKDFLAQIFEDSFTMEHIYRAYRVRVALATNPSTPMKVLEFLFRNKNTNDWMLFDQDEYSFEDSFMDVDEDSYFVDPQYSGLEVARATAGKVENFSISTDSMWASCPRANLMWHLLDFEIEIESARESLLIAFAKNPALPNEWYEELASIEVNSVRYFLSKNPSISHELKARYAIENPTYTYKSSEMWRGHEVTLE